MPRFLLEIEWGPNRIVEDGKFVLDGVPSEGWLCLGVRERRPFGRLGSLIPLADVASREYDAHRFKNGSPRYVVAVRDHGTYCEQISPACRGIRPLDD